MKYLALFIILLCSCNKETKKSDFDDLKRSVKETYANIAFATYEDSLITAKKLQTEILQFTKSPSAEGLKKCRLAWLAAREPYGLTEAFRFSNGPIDNKEGVEGALNAWPLDESFIDYVRGNDSAGIINNSKDYPEITKELILKLNEQTGETNISTGYHAIEFLLWGQDQEDTSLKTPGNRAYTDFTASAANAERRALYLQTAAELLIFHLETVLREWDEGVEGNFREKFLKADNNQSLSEIFNGLFNFSKAELAGERMFVALNNKDQEDEHSCFSDNTHRDIIQNFRGIQNLVIGSYTRLDGQNIAGRGLLDLLQKTDPANAKILARTVSEIELLMNDFPIPFDYALTEEALGQGKLSSIINKLMSLGDLFSQSVKVLNPQQKEVY
ncbi:MAG: hypothetical protein NE327_14035 [Lentisphaeraceae bacterium]|nr:hypothetical protein [Lentisphaeraceae bacterium]